MNQPTICAAGDRVVALIIRNGNIVLIHRYKQGREYYVLPGGSLERGETLVQACMREVAEETGLFVKSPRYLCTKTNQGRAEHYFLVETDQEMLVLGGPERERFSTDNQYVPVWVERAKVTTLNIQPPEARQLILAHL